MVFNKSDYEASLLEKYCDAFPRSFVECVRAGCTWLVTHNGLTYQTSALLGTDDVIYENTKSSILKMGLINVDKPLTGKTPYSVRTIKEEKDSVSGNTIYKAKLDYVAPVGIEVTLVPVQYFDPYADVTLNYYTKDEVDGVLNEVKSGVDEKNIKLKEEVDNKLSGTKTEITDIRKVLNNLITILNSNIGTQVPPIPVVPEPEVDENGNTIPKPEVPETPETPESGETTPPKPVPPMLQGLTVLEQIHSLAINIDQLANEHDQFKLIDSNHEERLVAVEENVTRLSVSHPIEMDSGVVPSYTKQEIDKKLSSKVESSTFEAYKVEAEARFEVKQDAPELPEPPVTVQPEPETDTGKQDQEQPGQSEVPEVEGGGSEDSSTTVTPSEPTPDSGTEQDTASPEVPPKKEEEVDPDASTGEGDTSVTSPDVSTPSPDGTESTEQVGGEQSSDGSTTEEEVKS